MERVRWQRSDCPRDDERSLVPHGQKEEQGATPVRLQLCSGDTVGAAIDDFAQRAT